MKGKSVLVKKIIVCVRFVFSPKSLKNNPPVANTTAGDIVIVQSGQTRLYYIQLAVILNGWERINKQ